MKTNRTLKLITLTAAIFGFAATSFAQNEASATAVASAGIITPITIQGTDLRFGTIFSSSSPLTATVTPDGQLTGTGVTEYNGTGNVSHQPATFTVNGNENNTFVINVTNLPTVVTHATESGVTMAIGNWTSTGSIIDFETGSGVSQLVNGVKTFSIGATLSIGASQTSGSYTSDSFTVTVNYN